MPLPNQVTQPLDRSLFTDATEWYTQLGNGQVYKLLLGDIKAYILDGVTGGTGGGTGDGDMLKAEYDTDNDGISDRAETADSVEWNNVQNAPSFKLTHTTFSALNSRARITAVQSQVTALHDNTTGIVDITLDSLNSASSMSFLCVVSGNDSDTNNSDNSLTFKFAVANDTVNSWDNVQSSIANDLWIPTITPFDAGYTVGGIKRIADPSKIEPEITFDAGIISFRYATGNFTSLNRVLFNISFN